MQTFWTVVIPMLVVAIPGGIYLLIEARRRRGLRRLAEALGLSFRASLSPGLAEQLSHIDMFRRCDVRNVLQGVRGDWSVLACDVHARDFKVGHGDTVRFSACVHPLEMPLPDLRIQLRSVISKRVEDALQDLDVRFESDAFSHRFRVLCPDHKFACDVCHALMMTWLLTLRHWRIEIIGGYVIVTDGRRWNARRLESALDVLTGFLDRIPDFVWREWREKADMK